MPALPSLAPPSPSPHRELVGPILTVSPSSASIGTIPPTQAPPNSTPCRSAAFLWCRPHRRQVVFRIAILNSGMWRIHPALLLISSRRLPPQLMALPSKSIASLDTRPPQSQTLLVRPVL